MSALTRLPSYERIPARRGKKTCLEANRPPLSVNHSRAMDSIDVRMRRDLRGVRPGGGRQWIRR